MLKKEEIYVSVESKEQAEIYRKVLEAMGEDHNGMTLYSQSVLERGLYFNHSKISNRWCIAASFKGYPLKQITFGELIDLLQRKPLLISEDGVPIYDGDKYFAVNLNEMRFYPSYDCGYKLHKTDNVILYSDEYKAFSTKQAALEWIESQKPKHINVKLWSGHTASVTHGGVVIPVQAIKHSDIEEISNAIKQLQNG